MGLYTTRHFSVASARTLEKMLKELVISLLLVKYAYGDCPETLRKDVPCLTAGSTCYCFSFDKVTWNEANVICRNNTAYPSYRLVSIENQLEKAAVEAGIANVPGLEKCNSEGFWTSGMYRFGTWRWESTGNDFTYVNWAPNQPDNIGFEDCVALGKSQGYQWGSERCDASRAFICEGPV